MALVEALASSPLPPPIPCDEDYFLKCMTVMQASLPRRASDDMSGEALVDAYRWKLGSQPRSAISHLTSVALDRCKWFPTIAECMEIIGGWTRNDEALRTKRRAEVLARNERLARLDETIAALENGELDAEQIYALPDRFRDIALTRGLIWADPDGTYRPRPLRRPEALPETAAEAVDMVAAAFPSERAA